MPDVGYFMVRLRSGAVEVPASVLYETLATEPGTDNPLDRSPQLVARILGEPVAMHEVIERKARRITKAEYDYQIADHAHAKAHRPGDPKAEPRKKINLQDCEPLF